MERTASLFVDGDSQAVRLPADCWFKGDRVYVRRDERTGDVLLSSHPHSAWSDFVRLRAEIGPLSIDADFMEKRVLNAAEALRDPFADD